MPSTKEKQKEYRQTETGKMFSTISDWKRNGLLMDNPEDYLTIYYHWLCSTNCEKCPKEFDNTKHNDKHMDHNHNTGEYRNILCHSCNVNNREDNTSGTPNVSYNIKRERWRYRKNINKKLYQKSFKTKEEAIAYKKEFESGGV